MVNAFVGFSEDKVNVLQSENISTDMTQSPQYVHMAPARVPLSAQPHLNRQKDLVSVSQCCLR